MRPARSDDVGGGGGMDLGGPRDANAVEKITKPGGTSEVGLSC